MENNRAIAAAGAGRALAALRECNLMSARYGLSLTEAEMQTLAAVQAQALRDTQRVEFGPGPYQKLVYAFCDSACLLQEEYADTLAELCELFYHLKNESGEGWSDDELIERMKQLYEGPCHGSVDLMGDRLWQALHSVADDETEEELFEE